jgi:hypothetical protein
MKLSLFAAAIASVATIFVQAASAGVCINTNDIATTTPSKDATSIFFKMRNGQVWQNKLRGACPDLKYNGFVWILRGTEQVCDSQQSIRVINSGQVCLLGKFSKVASGSRR